MLKDTYIPTYVMDNEERTIIR